MPWKSLAQERWGNSPAGEKALGKEGVEHWNAATKGKHLLKRVVDKHRKTRELSMNTETLVRLNSILDDVITFDDDDKLKSAAELAGAGGLGAGAVLAHQAIKKTGGYAAQGLGLKTGLDLGARGIGTPVPGGAYGPGYRIGQVLGSMKGKATSALGPAKSAGSGLLDWIKSLGKGGAGAVASLNSLADDLIEMEGINKVAVGAGLAAGGAVGGVAGAHVYHVLQSQKRWAKTAKDNEYLKIAKDLYIDKHGAVFGHNHPDLKKGKITELSDESGSVEFARGDYLVKANPRLNPNNFKPGKIMGKPRNQRFDNYSVEKRDAVISRLVRKNLNTGGSLTPGAILGKQGKVASMKAWMGLSSLLDDILEFKSPIHIKKKNKGKFDALKKKTGKTTEELKHSKNPKTRERATFAENAKHWNKK